MSGKSRHKVRMSNLLEKSRHVNIEAIEDPTLINYLRLLECILDTNKNRKMSYYLTDIENKSEGDKRMKEIDYLRKIGAGTELDHQEWMKKFKKETEKAKEKFKPIKIKVINLSTGEEETFNTLKQFCEEYGFKIVNVSSAFNVQKTNKIRYKGLIIQKLK